jgi:hypothetical protein
MGEMDKIHAFKRGAIATLKKMLTRKSPQSLREAYDLATSWERGEDNVMYSQVDTCIPMKVNAVKARESFTNRRGETKSRESVICWNCKKKGHFASDCKSPAKKTASRGINEVDLDNENKSDLLR